MALKTAGAGYFQIPTQPAAGTSITGGAANVFSAAYVQMIASTAAAIYVVGVMMELTSTSKPTYANVRIATGGAGSETIVTDMVVSYSNTTGAAGTQLMGMVMFPFPIAVATATRIACKVADSVGALAHLVTLICINQANVVDAAINESANVAQWNGTNVATPATAGVPDVNVKNYNNQAAVTDANNFPKVDVEAWLATLPSVNVSGIPIVDVSYISGNVGAGTNLKNLMRAQVYGTAGSGSTTTSLVTSQVLAGSTSLTVATDQFKGMRVEWLETATANNRGASALITGNTSGATPTLTIAPALPAAPANGNTFMIVEGSVDVQTIAGTAQTAADLGVLPSANANADALLDRAAGVETGLTIRQALRLLTSAILGKVSGMATNAPVFRDVNDSKNRVTATTDSNGNRSAVTLDAT